MLGDKWSWCCAASCSAILHLWELHGNSLEGIATNILGARLKHLMEQGFLTAAPDPGYKQRTIYSFTEKVP